MIDTIQFPKKVNNKGYVQLKTDEGYIYEHVYIMEKLIGRKLKDGECIHHINHIKTDNRSENLFLFKSQAEHKSFENKVNQHGMTQPIRTMILNRWKEYDRNN